MALCVCLLVMVHGIGLMVESCTDKILCFKEVMCNSKTEPEMNVLEKQKKILTIKDNFLNN